MKVTSRQLGIALYEATLDTKGSELEKRLATFIELLVTHHALGRVNDVIAEFEKYRRSVNGIVAVEARSHHTLSAEQVNDIEAQIKKMTGKQAEVNTVVDETLGGGVQLRFNDMVVDATVKNRLERLRTFLRN